MQTVRLGVEDVHRLRDRFGVDLCLGGDCAPCEDNQAMVGSDRTGLSADVGVMDRPDSCGAARHLGFLSMSSLPILRRHRAASNHEVARSRVQPGLTECHACDLRPYVYNRRPQGRCRHQRGLESLKRSVAIGWHYRVLFSARFC